MKIRIDETIYEGTGEEIMETLRLHGYAKALEDIARQMAPQQYKKLIKRREEKTAILCNS